MKNRVHLLVLSAILLSSIVLITKSFAKDWPQFRGPGGLGISDETNRPVTWSDTENLAWRVALPGNGDSIPSTLGEKVFVTRYSGYGTGDRSQRWKT